MYTPHGLWLWQGSPWIYPGFVWQVPPASQIRMGHVLDAMKHNFGDLWEDAQMWEVCQYLYGNHKCTVPENVKAQIPKTIGSQ